MKPKKTITVGNHTVCQISETEWEGDNLAENIDYSVQLEDGEFTVFVFDSKKPQDDETSLLDVYEADSFEDAVKYGATYTRREADFQKSQNELFAEVIPNK